MKSMSSGFPRHPVVQLKFRPTQKEKKRKEKNVHVLSLQLPLSCAHFSVRDDTALLFVESNMSAAATENFNNPAILSSLVINAPIHIDCRLSTCPEKPIGKDALSALKEKNKNSGSSISGIGDATTDETSRQNQTL